MPARRLALLLLLMFLLAACQGSAVTPTPTPAAGVAQAPVTLTFWHPWSGSASRLLDELALDYQRQNPGVTILVQERAVAFLREDYRRAVLGGGSPDLVLLHSNRWIGDLAERGLILRLNEVLSSGDLADLPGRFYPFAIDGSYYNQQLYALPISYDLPVLFYNRANIPGGPPPNTEEWLNLARIERGRTPQRWGLAYNLTLDFTLPYLPAFGGAIFDEQGDLVLGGDGAEGTQQWLSWLRELRDRSRDGELLAVEDHQAIAQAVQSGQARLMVVDWASKLPLYSSTWGSDVGVAALPPLSLPGRDTTVPAVPAVHTEVLALSPRSTMEERRVALDFARWLTLPDQQQRLLAGTGGCATCRQKLPVAQGVVLEALPLSADTIEIARNGRAAATLPAVEASWSYVEEMVRAVLQDRLSAPDAVQQTAGQLCTLLRQPDC